MKTTIGWESISIVNYTFVSCNVNDVFTPAPSISLRRHRDSIRVPWIVSERVLITLSLDPILSDPRRSKQLH